VAEKAYTMVELHRQQEDISQTCECRTQLQPVYVCNNHTAFDTFDLWCSPAALAINHHGPGALFRPVAQVSCLPFYELVPY